RKCVDINTRHINHLLDLYLLPVLPIMEYIGCQRRADETVAAVRIMVKTRLQRDQPLFAKVDALAHAAIFEIPEMNMLAIFAACHVLEIEAGHERIWRCPFSRY